MPPKRREYGEGSIYQRSSDGRWIGSIENGWRQVGNRTVRDRIVVTGKTRRDVVRRLEERKRQIAEHGHTDWNPRTTVKQWIETYLHRRTQPPKPLSPNGYKAAAQPLQKWVIPAIGHRRIIDLTPNDIRKVDQLQYDTPSMRGGDRSSSTVAATRRQLMTCLNAAKADGATITDNVFLVTKPEMAESDRQPLETVEAVRCVIAAADTAQPLRWLLTLLYGVRQGEALGLVEVDPIDGEPCIDFDAKVIRLAWQLQELDYLDVKDKKAGFKVPRGYVAVHLSGRYHLTRPKTKAGLRELPMIPAIEQALRAWLDDERPANPWGLVFPTAKGKPCWEQSDREEWYALQDTASLAGLLQDDPLPPIWNRKGGRRYYIHECRNLASTELDEVGASDLVATGLLGHTTIKVTRGYQKARLEAKREAVALVAARLGIAAPSADDVVEGELVD